MGMDRPNTWVVRGEDEDIGLVALMTGARILARRTRDGVDEALLTYAVTEPGWLAEGPDWFQDWPVVEEEKNVQREQGSPNPRDIAPQATHDHC